MLAICWYSGCSFIVFGIKYALALFLCAAGCVCKILGIGPGLGSMSPHCNSVSLLMNKYPWSWSIFGFCLFNFRYLVSMNLVVIKRLGKAGIVYVSCLVEKCAFVWSLGM